MTEKLRDCFDEMVVYKDLKKSNFFSALGLPSFLRDWLLKKFADDEGNLDIDELTDFIHTYLPNKEEWVRIKDRIINIIVINIIAILFIFIKLSSYLQTRNPK